MNKIYVPLLAACLIIIASCNKKDTPAPTPNKTDSTKTADTFKYALADVDSVTIQSGGTTMQVININYISGTKQKVAIAIAGLPTNVTDSIAPISETPTYGVFITYNANGATAGAYPIIVTATSDSGIVYKDTFMLTVISRSSLITGKWQQEQWATDSNQNGVMDPNEVTTFPLDKHFTFNADGSGAIISSNLGGTPLPVNWSLQNGDHEMNIGQALTI